MILSKEEYDAMQERLRALEAKHQEAAARALHLAEEMAQARHMREEEDWAQHAREERDPLQRPVAGEQAAVVAVRREAEEEDARYHQN
jgi:hypothetical protein